MASPPNGDGYWTYWLGAAKISDTPQYRWKDGLWVSGNWIPWDTRTYPYGAGVVVKADGKWVDEDTSIAHHYICERGGCNAYQVYIHVGIQVEDEFP